MRQPRCAPALEVSDIANNALTTAFSMGAVGLDWQVTGFGNFSGNPNETDMIMRNGNTGPFNWYIDAVLQWTYVEGNPMSVRGVSNNIRGRELAGSIEAGYPIALMAWLTFEPQIQGIWQRVSFDDTQDPFSTITFDRANVFTGRAGWVLRGSFGSTDARWQPYLKGNVWWGSNGFDTVRFDDVPIQTGRNGTTTLEGGGGITGKLTRATSASTPMPAIWVRSPASSGSPSKATPPARDVVRLAAGSKPLARSDAKCHLLAPTAAATLINMSAVEGKPAVPSRRQWQRPPN